MTENEFRSVPRLAGIPLYDEADERAGAITTVHGAEGYADVRECRSLAEVRAALASPNLVPLGALRAKPDGSPDVIVVYFGQRIEN